MRRHCLTTRRGLMCSLAIRTHRASLNPEPCVPFSQTARSYVAAKPVLDSLLDSVMLQFASQGILGRHEAPQCYFRCHLGRWCVFGPFFGNAAVCFSCVDGEERSSKRSASCDAVGGHTMDMQVGTLLRGLPAIMP